jgi:hypothetical protein
MNNQTLILLCLVGAASVMVSLWSARRYDRQHIKSSTLIEQSDALQAREAALLERWEAVVTRLERVAERLDTDGRAA